MASALVADTHATIWYLLDDPRLSSPARHEMDSAAQAYPFTFPLSRWLKLLIWWRKDASRRSCFADWSKPWKILKTSCI
jgi:hypothetical protein